MKRIVADSGPLIAFARSGLLDLLQQVAGNLLVPSKVFQECTREATKPGAKALIEAGKAARFDVKADIGALEKLGQLPSLDAGEIAALALALDRGCPLLMDERLGRNVARLHKIPVIGSAGILLAAKERGLIGQIAPILVAWRAWGYFLAPSLLDAVLRRAGENPEEPIS